MRDAGALATIGAGCFGLVIGWIAYRTLRRREGAAQLSDIATVVGAVGGAAVTSVFDDADVFGGYSIGLAIGFFAYFAVAVRVEGKDSAARWMGT
jgi:uncharacterized membrane protein YeaQ/YmgE (transglycosylase-associated protein family)